MCLETGCDDGYPLEVRSVGCDDRRCWRILHIKRKLQPFDMLQLAERSPADTQYRACSSSQPDTQSLSAQKRGRRCAFTARPRVCSHVRLLIPFHATCTHPTCVLMQQTSAPSGRTTWLTARCEKERFHPDGWSIAVLKLDSIMDTPRVTCAKCYDLFNAGDAKTMVETCFTGPRQY